MAVSPSVPSPLLFPLPQPSPDEVAALRLVAAYLTRAGTQVASRLLGCPEPNQEAVTAAEWGNALLRGAALCAGLRDLADASDHPRRF